ncbi:hypothetical protein BX600DRAFT_498193 [Xylariales sp. PMI_506]|nr:hypothetical protein BX600DRAFT_498193 [Xylariales sp. PMI_506]
MIGSDNLRLQEPLLNPPFSFSSILVTNKARHVRSHFLSNGRPVPWKGFGDWLYHNSMREQVFKEDDQDPELKDVVLWTCISLDGCRKRGFYLQYRQTLTDDVNSTSLRQHFSKRYGVSEASLKQQSTEALVSMLSPILLEY